jgi:hypothetical protein
VLGAPRSGTTVLGSYLSSARSCLDLGEFGGFHAAYNIVPSALGAMPGPFRDAFLSDSREHARAFAENVAAERGLVWFCDATPWNLLAAAQLANDLPDALFVLCLRHYSGAVLSLRRSYESGFSWAGATWTESATLWASLYRHVGELPTDRVVPVSYDALATEPGPTLGLLRLRLGELGFDVDGLDERVLAVSHAPPASGPRPTIGVVDGEAVRLRAVPSFDVHAWSGDIHQMVWPAVETVHRELQQRYQGLYRCPPPPSNLKLHHDIYGLVPVVLDAW